MTESPIGLAPKRVAAAPVKRRPVWKRRLGVTLIALGVVAVLAVAGGTAFTLSLGATFDSLRTTLPNSQVFPRSTDRPPATTGAAASAQNILLLGSDTRGSAPTSLAAIRAQRSDTMLLVHIPADHRHAYVMSIMRDAWVDIPGHGMGKINAALSYGGVPLTVRVVESLLHVRVDHVAIVSFSGFSGLTDALGGVTVRNAVPFAETGYSFKAGSVALTGPSALAYVRARYPFADGDYQRVRNQQAYLAGVLRTILTPGVLLNPVKLQGTVAAIAPYVLTDRGLDSSYVASLAVDLRSLRPADVEYFTIPTKGAATEGGQSAVLLDEDGVAEIAHDLQQDTLGQYTPCGATVCR